MGAGVFEAGDVLAGRFELQVKLGAGGFGTVWAAFDSHRRATIALKIFHAEVFSAFWSIDRARVEVEALRRLKHPFIAEAYDWIEEGDLGLLSMRYVHGPSMAREIQRRARENIHFSIDEVCILLDRLCAAVTHAHEKGIVHRDLKPANIIVGNDQNPETFAVLDFGIAKLLSREASEGTTLGRHLGTALYMAPEQFLAAETGTQTDIFAIGAIAFELLTLRYAWARDNSGDPLLASRGKVLGDGVNSWTTLMQRVLRAERPSAAALRPELSKGVDAVLDRAFSVGPQRRQQSAAAFIAELRESLGRGLAPQPVRASRSPLVIPELPRSAQAAALRRPPTALVSVLKTTPPTIAGDALRDLVADEGDDIAVLARAMFESLLRHSSVRWSSYQFRQGAGGELEGLFGAARSPISLRIIVEPDFAPAPIEVNLITPVSSPKEHWIDLAFIARNAATVGLKRHGPEAAAAANRLRKRHASELKIQAQSANLSLFYGRETSVHATQELDENVLAFYAVIEWYLQERKQPSDSAVEAVLAPLFAEAGKTKR